MRTRVDYHMILDMDGGVRGANDYLYDFVHVVALSPGAEDDKVLVKRLMFPLDTEAQAQRKFLPINMWRAMQGIINDSSYQPWL